MSVRPKKSLGQHFLNDVNIAEQIVNSLSYKGYENVLEIGPGKGVLTQFLLEKKINLKVIELDHESVEYLNHHFPSLKNKIISGDFLHADFEKIFSEPFAVIGNFPYNISTQILFKVLENRNFVPELAGMFQKEVAKRIASPPGNRDYGLLSVFVQAFFETEYLFTVDEHVFSPPPKVKSGMLRLKNKNYQLQCDEKLFFKVVKTAFNQRRKTLHNALKQITGGKNIQAIPFLKLRAEQLSWQQFEELTMIIQSMGLLT